MKVSPQADLLWEEKGNILNFHNKTSFYLVVSKFQVCGINLVKYHTVELLSTKLDEK